MPGERLPRLHVVGRFPPPLDGQAIATARLATLLGVATGGPFDVNPVDVGAPEGRDLIASSRFRLDRATHFLRLRNAVSEALDTAPTAPVLWPSISPSPLGHLRDRLVVAAGFRPLQRVYGVVHRGDFARLFTSVLTRRSGQRLLDRLAGVVFLSASLADRCAPWIPQEKRFVIPNTLEDTVAAHADDAASRPEPTDTIRLLFLSNMIPSKGYADVLEAVRVLHARGHDARASFVGRWPSPDARASFQERIRQLELANAVDVLGGISDRARIRQLYLASHLFVLPTTYPVEAQPLTVIEALAAGTPVIVTRHASLPEMIDDGVEGAFVAPRAPGEIADAALALTDPSRWSAASKAARERFERQFSPYAVRQHWLRLLTPY